MRLKEIRLPAGDVGSITVGWAGTTGEDVRLDPTTWLKEGYDGVRLIGAGVGRTQVRCTSWDGITLKVARHPGVVRLEGVTLVAGASRAALVGTPDKSLPIARKFAFQFVGSSMFVPEPTGGGRPAWGFHLYQVDDMFEDCELDATHASEHAYYAHGNAKYGSLWRRVKVRGSGGENDKVRSDATETLWAGSKVWIIREDVEYSNWYQPWSNRGGAASVRQGTGANLRWTRCLFRCGKAVGDLEAHMRSKTIMVTSEDDSYDATTGAVDKVGGHGNGQVIVQRCGASGGPGTENLSLLLRVGRVAGLMQAAKSVLVDECGWWGERMQLQFDSIPNGKTVVRRSNTQPIKAYCEARGLDTRHEAGIPGPMRVVPVSEGIVR